MTGDCAVDTGTYADIHFWFYFFDVGVRTTSPLGSARPCVLIGLISAYYCRRAVRFCAAWGFFSFVAFFLSLDETLELHERLDVLDNALARHVPFELGFT
ncbi:hypothetical protein [Arthrobacter subterraneus]|uniref:hypothetical protein n=1 Tax=Arthrobacter subterraneus TaxID=335973 RepID=UPI00382C49EF